MKKVVPFLIALVPYLFFAACGLPIADVISAAIIFKRKQPI